jgi:uncharacterized protein (DUF305 family)
MQSNTVQPGAPGDATGPVRVVRDRSGSARIHTAGDTGFMQGMIAHHAQALEMTALVPSRSENEGIGLLARRIEDSQRAEILLMQRWLLDRGEDVPDETSDPHHGMGHAHDALMPGMLTPEEMNQLKQSTGGEFEKLFLTYMISHHEGALVMVDDLLTMDGAAQDGAVFRFATDVDADQRMEIRRMYTMLEKY